MASSLVIIVRLIGMSVSMSSMTAYGLRRTTVLGREMLSPEDALDLRKDGASGARRRDADHRRNGADFCWPWPQQPLASPSCCEEEKCPRRIVLRPHPLGRKPPVRSSRDPSSALSHRRPTFAILLVSRRRFQTPTHSPRR